MAPSEAAHEMEAASSAYDSFDTIPEYAGLRDALRAQDWPRFDSILSSFAPDEASYAISLLAELTGIEDVLQAAVTEYPESSPTRTALAMRYIVIGWASRGGGPAKDVSAQRMARFREGLVRAEQLLIEVCADRRPYAPAWVARVLTARALEVGESEARRRYEHVVRLSPDDLPGAAHMLQYLLPKWLGSLDEARAFVLATVARAPLGSNCGALVALQHVEQWSDLGGGAAGMSYLAQPDVIAELRDAAARSVLHPDHVMSPLGVQAHSAFAMAFWLADHNPDAAVHLHALGGRASEYPWNLAPPGADALDDCRTEVVGMRRASA